MLDACSETCGLIAGAVGALSFGSFGVPIKFITNVKVDPLVMQSYKSTVCFLTCWLVIPLGEPFRFSPWGIVSGLFWVPGATAGIYGIRNAGLAISVGTWSSLNVIISFFWGILVFDEKVKSLEGAGAAALVLIIGLIGMSINSAPVKEDGDKDRDRDDLAVPLLKEGKDLSMSRSSSFSDDEADVGVVEAGGGAGVGSTIEMVKAPKKKDVGAPPKFPRNGGTHNSKPGIITRRKKTDGNVSRDDNKKANKKGGSSAPAIIPSASKDVKGEEKDDEIYFFEGRIKLTKRQVGIIGAVINGVWGGNSMIPLHYASQQGFHGAGYLISFSTGAMLVTVLMWISRYFYNLYCWDFDKTQAYNALPSLHIREMWLAGFLSGSLYSLGNFCSIMAVTSLGQAVGYSFVQAAMLVSGIWGIFYFGEVQGFKRRLKWLLSSVVTIGGILWLSYEHQGAVAHRRLLAIDL